MTRPSLENPGVVPPKPQVEHVTIVRACPQCDRDVTWEGRQIALAGNPSGTAWYDTGDCCQATVEQDA